MASTARRTETHLTPSRSNFMILVMTTLLGFVGLGYVVSAIMYLIPRKGAGSRKVDLGKVGQNGITGTDGSFYAFQGGQVAGPITYDATGQGDAQGLFAVRLDKNSSGVDLVIEQTCTHLGCPVAWGGSSGTFNCPCHGSVYNIKGEVTHGPAPHSLYRHSFQVTNGEFFAEGREA